MLSFTRKRFVVVLGFFCCALTAVYSFGWEGKSTSEISTPAAFGEGTLAASSVTVSLPNILATPGVVLIPITVGDTTGQGIISYDLNIDFDPVVVQPANPAFVQTGTLSSSMSITPNSNNPGHLIISAFQSANLTGAGTLLILRFNSGGTIGQFTPLVFMDYTDPGMSFHPGFVFNEGNPPVLLTNGSITYNDATSTNTNTPTPTWSATNTPTASPTPTITPTNTITPTRSPTPTGTATITLTPTSSPTPGVVQVALPHVSATPGILAIPIVVSDVSNEGIVSYDLNVDYDPAVVTPAGGATCALNACFTQSGTLSSSMSVTPNAQYAGHLIIEAFQGSPLTGSGTLLFLRFNVIGVGGQSTPLVFADYTDPGGAFHSGFVFNKGTPLAATTNGSVVIVGCACTPTNTVTATATRTPTVTATVTGTNTLTPTNTATNTPTSTPTVAPTASVTPTGPQYQIFDIGVVQAGDSASQGNGVSTGGVAVGRSIRTGGAQAFSYTSGGGIVGLPNLSGRTFAVANAAADNGSGGVIVGTAANTLFGTARLPVIWFNNLVVSQLALPPGETLGDAFDVNSSSVAVGSVNSGIAQRGAIYNSVVSGSVITATTSNGSFFTTAFGINDSGRVAGIGVDPNNAARNVPMVWDVGAGSAIDIGALPGFNGGIPFAIGNGGHVVGASMLNQGSGLPFIWTPGGGMVAIPLAAGTSQGSARGVNTAGWAVGTDSSAFAIPFLYNGTATYRLQDLIPAGTGWDLSTNTSSAAMGISDNNIIVGTGVLNGIVHAFSMVPAGQSPTTTPTATRTSTATPTATATCACTPTATATTPATSTPTSTSTATFTATITPTNTPNFTATATPTMTVTMAPTPAVTVTETPGGFPMFRFTSSTYAADESQTAVITILRSGTQASGTGSVSFSTSNGTATGGVACTAGVDYISITNQSVIFTPGVFDRTVNITICADNITEPDETINLSLAAASLGTPSMAVLTVHDVAPTNTPTATATPTYLIQFSSPTYIEDETQTAIITATRTGDLSGTNTVIFNATNGTATGGVSCTAGVDYFLPPIPLVVFNPGDTTATAIVPICGDNIREPDETVNLSLTGSNLGSPSTAVLTINDTASQFKNSGNIAINGGGPGGPYPSTINVSGGPPAIGSMRVTLYDYSGSFPDDTDFLLIGPGGQNMILMADSGGLSPSGQVTLNFSDTAGAVVADSGPLVTGDFEPTSYGTVANFPGPAPAGPYHEPGSTIGGNSTQTLFGNFGGTNSNGVWSLYVRNQTLIPRPDSDEPSAVIANVAGGWGIEFLSSTAAPASISGRVMTADGAGIRNAKVVITGNSLSEPSVMTTGAFGYFTFEGLQTGETYVVTVNSQRYTFSTPSRVVSLVDTITDADFVADPLE